MRNRKEIAAVVIAALILAPAAFAGGHNDVSYTRSNQPPPGERGQHAMLGLTVGALAGIIIGGYAAVQMVDNDEYGNNSEEKFIGLWTVFSVGGALAGYAIAGGFSDHADQALDLGRERVREAELASAAAAAPLPELRMSSIAGFDQLASAVPETAVPVLVATLR